ncbi:hypothetical protein OEZ86_011065 [Tetradesmus obliquus]|nr:hypothetical protein OEZ86_011065 [Tetradesmus obliquus]
MVAQRHVSSSGEPETAKVSVDDTVVVPVEAAAAVTIMDSATAAEAEAAPAEVSSHPLTDMFGAQELLTELQDQDQFGKRGEAWTFAQVAAIVLVLLPPFQLVGLVDILATLLITSGVVFMLYGIMSLGRFISPLAAPRKSHELITTGMYNYVRHPMYGGLLMAAFGLAVITRSETRLAMAALLWVVLEKKVTIEERMLLERYGQVYQDFKAKVTKKFFPFVY